MASKTLNVLAATGLVAFSLASAAQNYPERPIRLILGVAAGGGQETIVRAMSPKLYKALGVNIIIDNRPGAAGTIAIDLAKQAAPDGYTLLMVSSSNVIHPLIYGATYDIQRDFSAVTQLVTQPYLLTVTPGLPAKTVGELIAYGKANPGKLNFGSAGNGTITHLAAEFFKDQAQIETVHVPYKGVGAAYPDLIAGRIQAAFVTIVSAQGHVKAGRLRALAVSSPKRASAAPGVPTVAESGLPGYAVSQWYGVLVPAATPRAVVTKLNGVFVGVIDDPEMTAHFAKDGAEAASSTPQELAALLKSERERWTRIIAKSGLQSMK